MVLKDDLDPEALAAAFARHGRLQIGSFLRHDAAIALYRELLGASGWKLAVNRGTMIHDHDEAEIAEWPPEKRAAFERELFAAGRDGFQFRYDALRIDRNSAAAAPPMLRAFFDLINDPATIGFMRTLTGLADIAFADAHATRYRTGHFLTAHDDLNDQMGRRVAYVMNLTPQWRPDWGGYLQFYDERGNLSEGFVPAFNVMNLFRVPQPHSVSWVTPLAGAARYSVTGWLRAGRPD